MSIFLSAGEASGDHYTANLAANLRSNGFKGELWGMGGVEARSSGMKLEWEGDRLQLLGLTEVLAAIPSIYSLLNEMTARIIEREPEAVVVCDSPDYHMRLIARLRAKGYKGRIFYLSPPTVWAWRSSRADDLRDWDVECLPLFEFEHKFLLNRGCKSHWLGHPLLEEFRAEANKPPLLAGRFDRERTVAFLPGSRRSEIHALLPMMQEASQVLAERGWQPVFSVAPGLNPTVRENMIEKFENKSIPYYDGPGHNLMAVSRCAVGASGTITVESLLLDCFMVVTYRLNPLSALAARFLIKTPYFAMANILAGCELFPELMQGRATRENIVRSTLAWLEDGTCQEDTIKKMNEARLMLGSAGVYDFWSRIITEAA